MKVVISFDELSSDGMTRIQSFLSDREMTLKIKDVEISLLVFGRSVSYDPGDFLPPSITGYIDRSKHSVKLECSAMLKP